MNITVIVAIPANPLLHMRHLLHSLHAQTGEVEVVLLYDDTLALPTGLPVHWHTKALPALNVGQAWNDGLSQASGDYVCFTTADVYYHQRHFEAMQHTLRQQKPPGFYHLPQFMTPFLYELPTHPVKIIPDTDWLGQMLWADLPIPIGAMLFQRTTLPVSPFSTDVSYYNEEIFLAEWLDQHPLIAIDLPTVTSISGRSRPVEPFEQSQELIALFHRWCEQYPLASLVPSWARSPEQTPESVHHWLLQVLYNRNLLDEARQYHDAHPDVWPLAHHTVLWVTTGTDLLPESLFASGLYQPILLRLEMQPQPHQADFCVQFTQEQGLPVVALSNTWPAHSHPLTDALFPELLPLFRDILERYRPKLVHCLSLKGFSLSLAQWTVEQNIPLVCSWLEPWWLCPRGDLRLYGTEPCLGPLTTGVNCLNCHAAPQAQAAHYAERTRLAHQVLRQLSPLVLIHDEAMAPVLQQNGIQPTYIQSSHDLAQAYHRAATGLSTHKSLVLPSLFHVLSEHMSELAWHQPWVPYFRSCKQVLDYGSGNSGNGVFLALLHQADIPGTGYEPEATQRALIQSQGLPVHDHPLGRFIQQFDGMHVAYQLEHLRPLAFLKWLEQASLAVCPQGTLVIRTVDPNQSEWQKDFWLDVHHVRPWPVALVNLLLQHYQWEPLETGTVQGPWSDTYLIARRQNDILALAAHPIATTAFSEFWAQNRRETAPANHVLLIGQQVVPQWQLWRLNCERLQAIGLDLAEMAQVETSLDHHLRYSTALNKTLAGLDQTYDAIVLEGIIETLAPDELSLLLRQCRSKLNQKGSLWIHTMALTEDQHIPALFWESLWNLRPYADLTILLSQAGFVVQQQSQTNGIQTWCCHAAEPSESVDLLPLPQVAASWVTQGVATQTIASLEALRALPPSSCEFLYLPHVLEAQGPEVFQNVAKLVWDALKPDGYALFTGWQAGFWSHPMLHRPWPVALVNQWNLCQGFSVQAIIPHDSGWLWLGRKLLQRGVAEPKHPVLLWEGDVFEYHSLSLVNREILAQLVTKSDWDIEIAPYNREKYLPTSRFPALQKLLTHARCPLLAAPNVVVRHHWPPEFTPPVAGHWVMIQPWEFGAVPERWIYEMNKLLDELWVPSTFVKKTYEDSGLLPEKVVVVPNGVDIHHYTPAAPPLHVATDKPFKFLFVGGAIFRKGIDILLKAYVDEFSETDPVCLVIKEFGGGRIYNNLQIPDLLEQARQEKPDLPEVLHLTEDISLDDMPGLYTACDVLVHPYRGEGFGFPIAEAMACERAVIVTGEGACLDFCNADNAYLIPAERQWFDENKVDGMSTAMTPYWAVPSYERLRQLMRHVLTQPAETRTKAMAARQTIVERFSWECVSTKVLERLHDLQQRPVFRLNRERLLSEKLGQSLQALYQGRPAEAIEGFEYALKVDPYQPPIRYNLGICYLQLGDYAQALAHLSQSLREGDCTSDLCYAMAIALERLGDMETAQHFYTKSDELTGVAVV